MKENKLVKMVIIFIGNEKKKRHEVTNKIRNYPKPMRDEAIRFLVKGAYVFIEEDLGGKNRRGRTPAYISLTEKGKEKLDGYSSRPEHESVWNV